MRIWEIFLFAITSIIVANCMCTQRKNTKCIIESFMSYLGGIKWMPHSSPEDGLGGIFPSVSQLSYTVKLQSTT